MGRSVNDQTQMSSLGGHLRKVPNIVIWLEKVCFFGKLVMEEMWSRLTWGSPNWRFSSTVFEYWNFGFFSHIWPQLIIVCSTNSSKMHHFIISSFHINEAIQQTHWKRKHASDTNLQLPESCFFNKHMPFSIFPWTKGINHRNPNCFCGTCAFLICVSLCSYLGAEKGSLMDTIVKFDGHSSFYFFCLCSLCLAMKLNFNILHVK